MEVQVIEDRENKLLERREVAVKITFSGATPTRKEVKDRLIAVLNSDKDKLILGSINTGFGMKEAVADIRIYQSKDNAFKTEPRYVLRKNFPDEVKEEKKAPKEKPKKEAKKPK